VRGRASGAVVAAASWFAAVAGVTVELWPGYGYGEAMAMVAVLAACSAPSMAGRLFTKSRQPDTQRA